MQTANVEVSMSQSTENVVQIPVNGVELEGALTRLDGAAGLVVFAQGSGSSRTSPLNNFVTEVIRDRGLGTLLFDLLTEEEDQMRATRFDIPLLTDRLIAVTEWWWTRDTTRELNICYFGSSTGASSALRAAARLEGDIETVVSRGGTSTWHPRFSTRSRYQRCS
jgi:hypothetical protein